VAGACVCAFGVSGEVRFSVWRSVTGAGRRGALTMERAATQTMTDRPAYFLTVVGSMLHREHAPSISRSNRATGTMVLRWMAKIASAREHAHELTREEAHTVSRKLTRPARPPVSTRPRPSAHPPVSARPPVSTR
jgi:hypothetical protein